MYWRNPGWPCLLVVALILGLSCPVGAQDDGAGALLLGIDERAEEHVAADPREGIETEDACH